MSSVADCHGPEGRLSLAPSPLGGEGWGEGASVSRKAGIPHPTRHGAPNTRVNALGARRPLPMGEVKKEGRA